MTRRAPRYDNDPGVITRPDTVPAAIRFAEDSLTGFDTKINRELAPYPTLQPLSDEPTVNYAIVSPFADAQGHTPSDANAEARSGTQQMLASTVPPPSRTRLKLDSATNEDVERAEEHRSSPRAEERRPRAAGRRSNPALASMPAPAPMPFETPRKGTRTFLLGAVTAIVAAAIGASLGNGSLQGAVEQLFGDGTESAAVTLAPAPATPARSRGNVASAAPAPTAAEPRPAATAEASRVPVMSFQDLPPTKQEAEEPEEPQRKRGPAPRRR